MRLNMFFLSLVLLVFYCCNVGYKSSSYLIQQDSIKKNSKMHLLKLPDSLGGGSITGCGIVEAKILTENNRIFDVEIMRLFAKSKKADKIVIDYYHGIDTVLHKNDFVKMKQFKPSFENYYRSIKGIKNNQSNLGYKYYIFGININF